MGRSQRDKKIVTVERARELARRRVPPVVFDYMEGGAGAEATLRANESAIETVTFLPRLGVTPGSTPPDISTSVLGTPISMPVLLSPIGFTRMMERSGDVGGARAAGTHRTIFTLSTMSGHTMEEVAAAASMPAWFQLYYLGGRKGARRLVARARKAGFAALVLTMDTQVVGNRERDLRHGVHPPLQMNWHNVVKFAPQVARRPGWLWPFAQDGFRLSIVNAETAGSDEAPFSSDEAFTYWGASPPVWDDLEWLRDEWQGPILVKGVTTAQDAELAVRHGAAAVIVSNHGGRQLDGVRAGIRALVEVVDAVGGDVEVLVDGGFRRGSDVVKAVALGARAVMVGRPWAYGLATAGERGIEQVLSLFHDDIERTLRLLGCSSLAELDRSYVEWPASWGRA